MSERAPSSNSISTASRNRRRVPGTIRSSVFTQRSERRNISSRVRCFNATASEESIAPSTRATPSLLTASAASSSGTGAKAKAPAMHRSSSCCGCGAGITDKPRTGDQLIAIRAIVMAARPASMAARDKRVSAIEMSCILEQGMHQFYVVAFTWLLSTRGRLRWRFAAGRLQMMSWRSALSAMGNAMIAVTTASSIYLHGKCHCEETCTSGTTASCPQLWRAGTALQGFQPL